MRDRLKLGGIYRTEWDDRPFRVIGFDDIEVFYDCLWPHDNSWTFSGNFKRKCYFYRTSSLLFASKSELIEYVPLTEQEQNSFRPDLPMRMGRTKELNWNDFKGNNYSGFMDSLKLMNDNAFLMQTLQTNKIILIPYGNKGGLKKGIEIIADNFEYFECSELIWKAKDVQESVNNQISNGIGLYRIGFEKGLPSYYIGEYIDSAKLLKE
jgi:hypothetical protein